jgi:uncharacterized membrane protein YedE/YeeE
MQNFTPISALLGGALIGLAASLAALFHGRIAGVSGIVADVVDRGAEDRGFGAWFLGGLLLAGVLARFAWPHALPSASASGSGGLGPPSLVAGAAAGLLVGIGTRVGSGCTSGHGVCGLSRLSVRSLVATITFIATGVAVVAALHALERAS